MIICNGTIAFKTKLAPMRNADGEILAGGASYTAPIPCQYYANGGTLQGRDTIGNPVKQLSWTILIEERPIKSEQIELRDAMGDIVGEYSILRYEPLQAVSQIKILV